MKLIRLCTIFIATISFAFAQNIDADKVKQDIKMFKQELVEKFNFKQEEVSKVMDNAKYNEKIINTMNAPYEDHSYSDYRKLFINQKRIQEGREFLTNNNKYLKEVSEKYGISPEIIVAIIGIESNYGKNKTQYSTLDSLYTLAFYYPKRAKFFRYELAQFLILCRELKMAPESIQGSYAGALGIPQFMPSSYRHFARTTSKNHLPNLFNDKYDAMSSIGNYLNHFGWTKNEDTAIAINKPKKPLENMKKYTVSEINNLGVKTPKTLKPKQIVKVLEVDKNTTNPSTWLTLANFDVIKKYNKSDLYVLVVSELADLIKQRKA